MCNALRRQSRRRLREGGRRTIPFVVTKFPCHCCGFLTLDEAPYGIRKLPALPVAGNLPCVHVGARGLELRRNGPRR